MGSGCISVSRRTPNKHGSKNSEVSETSSQTSADLSSIARMKKPLKVSHGYNTPVRCCNVLELEVLLVSLLSIVADSIRHI